MAGIAVDAENDEVHISDENRSSIMTFRRTDNSGPRQGEPLRQIIGPRTSLEFICGITVDPRRREVYGVNNDVADNMVVFGPDQTGDSPPRRELKVDHGAWGVALDEQNEEVANCLCGSSRAREPASPIRTESSSIRRTTKSM
jgi:hypothetical protein